MNSQKTRFWKEEISWGHGNTCVNGKGQIHPPTNIITFTMKLALLYKCINNYGHIICNVRGPLGYVTDYFVFKIYMEKSRADQLPPSVCYLLQEFLLKCFVSSQPAHMPEACGLYYCTPFCWVKVILLSKVCMTLLSDLLDWNLNRVQHSMIKWSHKQQQQQHW
jgi:hypothetical protein